MYPLIITIIFQYLVAFYMKNQSSVKCNFDIYDKKLIAIYLFEHLRPKLEGSVYSDKVVTDHKNQEYFMPAKQIFKWQAR